MDLNNRLISAIKVFLPKAKVAGDVIIAKIKVVRNIQKSYFPKGTGLETL
eukprot:UN11574